MAAELCASAKIRAIRSCTGGAGFGAGLAGNASAIATHRIVEGGVLDPHEFVMILRKGLCC
jgi:hypothetical protein